MANNYKKTVAGTVGAGMRSVFSGSGRKYYILEYKNDSLYHRAGESQEIIVDQIELGRDPNCQVRYDDKYPTVSRRHAAIVKEGEGWKLVQLSSTNKTFLNGKPIEKEWFLQNGDEIQLSVNGPRLGFIVPQGNKSTVNTIGLSRRLSLFRQQALRPYRTAVTIISILLILAIALGIFFIVRGNKKINEQQETIQQQEMKLDSVTQELQKISIGFQDLKGRVRHSGGKSQELTPNIVTVPDDDPLKETKTNVFNNVFYIQVMGYTLEQNGETEKYSYGDEIVLDDVTISVDGWIATAFLLENGKLVTARHCVEGWYYNPSTPWQVLINNLITAEGVKVTAHLTAVSPNGQRFSFSSRDVICSRAGDHPFSQDGFKFTLAGIDGLDPLDFAYINTNLKGGLKFDNVLSVNLKMKTKLEIYGYPHGWGVTSLKQVSPILGSGVVAKDGLEDGVILVGSASFESGHSGSPAFYVDEEGNYTVVGIVSSISKQYGTIVPINKVK